MNHLTQAGSYEWAILAQVATIVGFLLGLLLVAQILTSQRVPSATFGWIILIVILPFIGIPLYLLLGKRKFNAQVRRKTKILLSENNPCHVHDIQSLLVALGVPASTKGNIVTFHQDGKEAYTELVKIIKAAENSIDIASYIFENDEVGRDILAILDKKIKQGVKVRLLIDGIGSFRFPAKLLRQFKKTGGEYAWFIPLLHGPFNGRSNLRLHRKMIIVDHCWLWSGGRNISAHYFDLEHQENNWIDLSFTQNGPAAACYSDIFESDWQFATGQEIEQQPFEKESRNQTESLVQVLPSGPDVNDDPLYAAIITACYKAKSRITIVTPYFIPGAGLEQALKLASLRGVKVNIVLPKKSDHFLADLARNRSIRSLADSNVAVWMLSDSMLHAKTYIFDDDFALCGSANLDIRSLFLNCEVMSCFYSEKDINWLNGWSDQLINQTKPFVIKPEKFFRKMLEGIILLAAYQL